MSQRHQLRLAFSNNTLSFSPRQRQPYSKPPRTSRAKSPRDSQTTESMSSAFLLTMRELERVNPVYAHVLEKLARQMIVRAEADVATE